MVSTCMQPFQGRKHVRDDAGRALEPLVRRTTPRGEQLLQIFVVARELASSLGSLVKGAKRAQHVVDAEQLGGKRAEPSAERGDAQPGGDHNLRGDRTLRVGSSDRARRGVGVGVGDANSRRRVQQQVTRGARVSQKGALAMEKGRRVQVDRV